MAKKKKAEAPPAAPPEPRKMTEAGAAGAARVAFGPEARVWIEPGLYGMCCVGLDGDTRETWGAGLTWEDALRAAHLHLTEKRQHEEELACRKQQRREKRKSAQR